MCRRSARGGQLRPCRVVTCYRSGPCAVKPPRLLVRSPCQEAVVPRGGAEVAAPRSGGGAEAESPSVEEEAEQK